MHKHMERRKGIGLFGGTFDPIHFGHLRAALEIYENLKLDEMRIIPCKQPPHRTIPKSEPFVRMEMVRLAVMDTPLILDDREMHREGPSYTVDTLMSFRREFPKASLCLLVGVDTFLGLTSWHQWEKIIQLANIIVMHRQGWAVPETGNVSELLQTYALENDEHITDFTCGRIITQSITPLDISATKIRGLLKSGHSPRFLCPDPVLKYIEAHRLYEYSMNNRGIGYGYVNPVNTLPTNDYSMNDHRTNDYRANDYSMTNGYDSVTNHHDNMNGKHANPFAKAETLAKTDLPLKARYNNGIGYSNGLPAVSSGIALTKAGLSAVALAKAETNNSMNSPQIPTIPPEVTHV